MRLFGEARGDHHALRVARVAQQPLGDARRHVGIARLQADGAARERGVERRRDHPHAGPERTVADPPDEIKKQVARRAAFEPRREPQAGDGVVPVAVRQARAFIERHREMQQRMVLIVAADAGTVGDRRNADPLQLLRRTDAGAQQDRRRVDRAGTEHHLGGRQHLGLAVAFGDDPAYAAALDAANCSTRVLVRISRFARARTSLVR